MRRITIEEVEQAFKECGRVSLSWVRRASRRAEGGGPGRIDAAALGTEFLLRKSFSSGGGTPS